MVDREILRQRDIDDDFLRAGALGGWDDVEDLRADEAPEEFEGVLFESLLFGGRFVAVVDDSFQRGATVLVGAGEDVEEGVMKDGETGDERLGRGRLEFREGLLVPVDEAFFRRLAFLEGLLLVRGGFRGEAEVLDDVLGSLRDDVAGGVEAASPGTADDLAEIADCQDFGTTSIILAERCQHHGANRDVDADAEGVGAADDFQQAASGEFFHQQSIFRQ